MLRERKETKKILDIYLRHFAIISTLSSLGETDVKTRQCLLTRAIVQGNYHKIKIET